MGQKTDADVFTLSDWVEVNNCVVEEHLHCEQVMLLQKFSLQLHVYHLWCIQLNYQHWSVMTSFCKYLFKLFMGTLFFFFLTPKPRFLQCNLNKADDHMVILHFLNKHLSLNHFTSLSQIQYNHLKGKEMLILASSWQLKAGCSDLAYIPLGISQHNSIADPMFVVDKIIYYNHIS